MNTKDAIRLAKTVGKTAYIEKGQLHAWGDGAFLKVAVSEPDTPPKNTSSLLRMAQAGVALSFADDAHDDLPSIPPIEGEAALINTAALLWAIKHHAASKDESETREILHHVWATGQEIVSADGYRLHVYPCTMPACNFRPHPALATIKPYFVRVGAEWAAFEGETATLNLRLCHVKVPNWHQIIPTTAVPRLRVRVKEAVAAAKSGAVLLRDEQPFSVVLRGNEIADKRGRWSRYFGELLGEAGEVTLNPKYLAEALAGCDDDTATISWTDSLFPCLIESGQWRAVVMSMSMR